MIKLSLALAIMIVLLGGCIISTDHDDFVTGYHPMATVSVEKAATGEFIDVAIENTLWLRETSRVAERTVYVELGACFEVVSSEEVGGFCNSVLPLPNGLDIAQGDSFSKDYGKVVFNRGESVNFKHSFRLSASQPSEVIIVPLITIRNEDDEQAGLVWGVGEERAFVEFE